MVSLHEHWLLPPDANLIEREIAQELVMKIYDRFPDVRDKLIISLVYELGYPQRFAAEVLGLKERAVRLRIKKIKTVLSMSYKNYLKSDSTE